MTTSIEEAQTTGLPPPEEEEENMEAGSPPLTTTTTTTTTSLANLGVDATTAAIDILQLDHIQEDTLADQGPDTTVEKEEDEEEDEGPLPSSTTKGIPPAVPFRRHSEEVPSSSRWRQHSKHFFVLSSAGKPIYSRYGDEAKLASIMGVIQAIWSFVAAENDTIRCLNAGSHRFVFLAKGPLYLVSVSTTKESDHQLRQQLEYLYLQLLFVLTSTQLTNIFERRRNYDLRNLISGTEMFLDHLSSSFQRSSGLFLGSVQCLRMVSRLRQKVGSILASNLPETVVFAILIAKEKLVTLVRPKRHSLHPTDLRLLINMVSSSSGFRSVETWTPVCLPQFNNRSFLHAYVSFLGPELYLVMASTSKDAFFELSEYKQRLVQELETTGTVEAIEEAITADPYSGVELEIPSVRHFIYKSSTLVQHTEPALAPPYTRKEDLQRLFRAYQFGLERYNVVDDPARVVFFTNTAESVLCCFTPTHQILLAFSPFITKAAALDALHGLQKWIKREESTLFLSTAPVF